MKTFISMVLTTFLFLSWAPSVSAHAHQHGAEQSQSYACPMHPEVTGNQGDSCPKCGMDLQAVKAAGHQCDSCPNKGKHAHHQMTADTHACPMNPAITGKAGDSCPKCGMELQAMETKGKSCDSCPHKGKSEHHKMSADTHACPMNPAITGKEGDSCPKCGMDLMPIATSDKADQKSHMHH